MKQLGSFVERDLEGSTHLNGAMNCEGLQRWGQESELPWFSGSGLKHCSPLDIKLHGSLSSCFFFFFLNPRFISLVVPGLSCGMWDLVP